MNRTAFRWLLALPVALVALGIAWDLGFLAPLVAPVEKILTPLTDGLTKYSISAFLRTLSLGVFAVAWIGLFFFWRHARLAYVLSFVIGYIALLLMGPHLSSAVAGTLTSLATLVSGVILAVIYLPPVRGFFHGPAT